MRRTNSLRVRPSGYFASGSDTLNVVTRSASKPGRTCCSMIMLRSSSPAPTSSTSESAISPAISRRRARLCTRVPPRAERISVRAFAERALAIIGNTPKIRPAINVAVALNTNTCTSIVMLA
jgi:hypothetical protein